MATTVQTYDQTKQILREYGIDGSALKLALFTSVFSFNAADTSFDDKASLQPAGTGYTSGGETLTNVVVNADGSIDADDIVWSGLTLTFRVGAIYLVGTFGAVVNPLLFYYLYDDTPADIVVVSSTFTHIIAAAGIAT